MVNFSKLKKSVFIGYNLKFGSQMYETLKDVPKEKILETPLAENLMMGLGIGMSLRGYKPMVIFERHDFILDALDQIVNHADKLQTLSDKQFSTPVVMRAIVGAQKPLFPGVQHIQDYTAAIKRMVSFPVIPLEKAGDILPAYDFAMKTDKPVMLIEWRDRYVLEI
jgi:pyruvate/2-oxoglutarate/acetoin dehydrogenase E1 component